MQWKGNDNRISSAIICPLRVIYIDCSAVTLMMITPDSIVCPIVTIVVEGLSEGIYLFTVRSQNIFSPHYTLPMSLQVFVYKN